MKLLDKLKTVIKNALPESAHLYIDYYYAQITWPIYSGSAVHCPVCGGDFRKFLGHFDKLQNERCPRCRAYSRHRLLWLYLKKKTDLFRARHRVLHMAPEFLLQIKLKRMKNLDYTSADLYSPLAMMKTDITDMPFRDAWFDVILCSHVLEHIADDHAAMSELYRVMRPGGWAILQVPMADADKTYEDFSITDPKEREKHFGQVDHVRMYGRDYADRLRKVGFEVTVDDFVRRLSPLVRNKLGLAEREDIYFCRKH